MTGEARAEACESPGSRFDETRFSEKRVTKPGWDPREMGSVWACTQFSPAHSCVSWKTRSVKKTALGRRAGKKNAESGWRVMCDERVSGKLVASTENSGAK